MSDNLEELRKKIMKLLKDGNYDTGDLQLLLSPINEFISNTTFTRNLNQIVHVIVKDRNGDNKIDLKDLELMSKDVLAITTIIKAILLILNTIPDMKLKYSAGATEELIFKILAYIFLVVIPKEAKTNWTLEEKETILDLVILLYDMIKSSQVVKELVDKITVWFKYAGGKIVEWFKNNCKCGGQLKEDVVEEHLPGVLTEIKSAMHKNREIASLRAELDALKK